MKNTTEEVFEKAVETTTGSFLDNLKDIWNTASNVFYNRNQQVQFGEVLEFCFGIKGRDTTEALPLNEKSLELKNISSSITFNYGESMN